MNFDKFPRKAGLILLLGIACSATGYYWLCQSELSLQRDHFDRIAESRVALFETKINEHLSFFEAVGRFFEGSKEVTEEEYATFVKPALLKHRDMSAIEWLEMDGKNLHVRYSASQDKADLDIVIEQCLRAANLRATTQKKMWVSHLRVSGGQHDGNVYVCFLLSIDEGDHPGIGVLPQVGQRGVLLCVTDLAASVGEIFRDLTEGEIRFTIDDLSASPGAQQLYSFPKMTLDELPQGSDHHEYSDFAYARIFNVAGDRWRLRCIPTRRFFASDRAGRPWIPTSLGVLLALMLAALVYQLEQKTALVETEVVARTKELAQSEERLALALEGAELGIWDWDISSGRLTRNERWAKMLGYGPEEIIPDRQWWEAGIHPDDRARVMRVHREHVEGKSQAYESEYRIRSASGAWVWIRDRGRIVEWDEQGQPLRMSGTHVDISKRKHAEEDRRLALERVLNHVEQTPLAVIEFDVDFKISAWNHAAELIFGFSRKDAIGMRAEELIVPPAARAHVEEIWADLISGEGGGRSTNENITAAGETRLCEWYNTPLLSESGDVVGVASMVQDVTEARRAEKALRLTQFAMDHVAEAAYWLGSDGQVIYVNHAACEQLGYARRELLRMTAIEIAADFPAEAWPGHWAELKARGHLRIEVDHRRKDGSVFPVEISANFLEFDGREFNCAFVMDLTDRKAAETKQRQTEARWQHAQKLESLGVLAGGIAHDFNNILAAIMGYADLALMELPPAVSARDSLEEIVKASGFAAELTKQMLAYSGKGKFSMELMSLNEVLRTMMPLMDIAVSKNVRIRNTLVPELPLIEGDPDQIRQIIMNLVINGSEAIGEDEGVLSVRTGHMQCGRAYLRNSYIEEDQPEGFYVFLEVSDSGCGMSPQTEAKIFEPFFTTKFTGRGLGMAAVLGIVRGHGGVIKVDSEPEEGTTIKVLFPARDGLGAEGRVPREDTVPMESWRGSGTILVVDDNDTVRNLACNLLQTLGFDVLTAADSVQALELFKAHGDQISLVLLDLTMPRIDGHETFQQLRALRPDVRVILSSGYSQQDLTQRFTGEAFSGFIQKPYRLQALAAVLKQALEEGT